MRRLSRMIAAVAWLGVPCAAHALIGTIDNVPAATLLLPYFEVDPAGTETKGVATTMSITNSYAGAFMTHVTIWTDAGVPVTAFDVYLTGYDTIGVDLKAVLSGTLPATGSAGQDPTDKISPKGVYSQDINFASCTGILPPSPVEASVVAKWQAALSGKPDPDTGLCSGFDHGDGILRGYITIDATNSCASLLTPASPGYLGVVTLDTYNYLFGTWTLVDKASKRYHSAPMVAIEASVTNPQTTVSGQYTFYGRYVNWTATDHREPLATSFGTRYIASGGTGSPNRTTLVVWRDTKVNQPPFTCSIPPAWFPLGQEGIFFWDEQETAQISTGTHPFGMATQKVAVDSNELPTTFPIGWVYLNLNASVTAAGAVPPEDPNAAQAWVEVLRSDDDPAAYGARSHVALTQHPVQLDSATAAKHVTTP